MVGKEQNMVNYFEYHNKLQENKITTEAIFLINKPVVLTRVKLSPEMMQLKKKKLTNY